MTEWETNNSKPVLYKKLDQEELIHLEEIFKSSKEQKFTINELESVLKESNITFSPEQLKSLFLKVPDFFYFYLFYERDYSRSIRVVTITVIGTNLYHI